MEKRKTYILLELIYDIIVEYLDTKEYIQQKLQKKCKREGILIDAVIFIFLASFISKSIFTNQVYHNDINISSSQLAKNTA